MTATRIPPRTGHHYRPGRFAADGGWRAPAQRLRDALIALTYRALPTASGLPCHVALIVRTHLPARDVRLAFEPGRTRLHDARRSLAPWSVYDNLLREVDATDTERAACQHAHDQLQRRLLPPPPLPPVIAAISTEDDLGAALQRLLALAIGPGRTSVRAIAQETLRRDPKYARSRTTLRAYFSGTTLPPALAKNPFRLALEVVCEHAGCPDDAAHYLDIWGEIINHPDVRYHDPVPRLSHADRNPWLTPVRGPAPAEDGQVERATIALRSVVLWTIVVIAILLGLLVITM